MPTCILMRHQYRLRARWSATNVPVVWFGEILAAGTAFLSFETELYNVVILGCPISGCRIAYCRRSAGFPSWKKFA